MVDYTKFDKIVQEDEEEEVQQMLKSTEELVTTFKELGNKAFAGGKYSEAVGQYTSCIVLLTGERDPRVPKPKDPEEIKKLQEEAAKQEKQKEKMKAKSADMNMPEGMTAIDPTQMSTQSEDPCDPMSEMGRSHEQGEVYLDDKTIEFRMTRCAIMLQQSEALRTLLASVLSNRSLCELKISEGKEQAFKDKTANQPGGIDKWDSYRVRMTADALNDARRSIQMDANNAKAWYRIGYAAVRLINLIDRIRERKPWLREDELPLLEKPTLWEEARQSLIRSLELCPQPATYEKLVEVYERMKRFTTIVRKLGHENIACEINKDTFILESVDEDGPSKKWGLDLFIGCKVTHLKVGDDGPMLPVTDLNDFIKRQTHASYVTLGLAPSKPPPELQPWSHFAPPEVAPPPDDAKKVRNAELRKKWGPPPPRKVYRKKINLSAYIVPFMVVVLAFFAFLLLN
eukprot:TRINITY_DN2784_c1_g1_i1.p1 TRINITY_DN2784_c1_g1~~TRINITY_DN2784_c1_g1_i1.p1  ORF type:complete len:470 (+),score=125.20 TRINITY_DN2784_c1_g1_i1:40-1410(+)